MSGDTPSFNTPKTGTTLLGDVFSEAHHSHFMRKALCEKSLVSVRHSLPRVVTLSEDSPSFNALEIGTTLPDDRFSEAHVSHVVCKALYKKSLLFARHAVPRAFALSGDSPF